VRRKFDQLFGLLYVQSEGKMGRPITKRGEFITTDSREMMGYKGAIQQSF